MHGHRRGSAASPTPSPRPRPHRSPSPSSSGPSPLRGGGGRQEPPPLERQGAARRGEKAGAGPPQHPRQEPPQGLALPRPAGCRPPLLRPAAGPWRLAPHGQRPTTANGQRRGGAGASGEARPPRPPPLGAAGGAGLRRDGPRRLPIGPAGSDRSAGRGRGKRQRAAAGPRGSAALVGGSAALAPLGRSSPPPAVRARRQVGAAAPSDWSPGAARRPRRRLVPGPLHGPVCPGPGVRGGEGRGGQGAPGRRGERGGDPGLRNFSPRSPVAARGAGWARRAPGGGWGRAAGRGQRACPGEEACSAPAYRHRSLPPAPAAAAGAAPGASAGGKAGSPAPAAAAEGTAGGREETKGHRRSPGRGGGRGWVPPRALSPLGRAPVGQKGGGGGAVRGGRRPACPGLSADPLTAARGGKTAAGTPLPSWRGLRGGIGAGHSGLSSEARRALPNVAARLL